ncbi:MAG: hypothetical protein ACTSRK_05680 [Promethearchaeota archaeon]
MAAINIANVGRKPYIPLDCYLIEIMQNVRKTKAGVKAYPKKPARKAYPKISSAKTKTGWKLFRKKQI